MAQSLLIQMKITLAPQPQLPTELLTHLAKAIPLLTPQQLPRQAAQLLLMTLHLATTWQFKLLMQLAMTPPLLELQLLAQLSNFAPALKARQFVQLAQLLLMARAPTQ